MKKFALLLIIIAFASQLKAQQLSIKPVDTLLLKAPKGLTSQQFKFSNSILFKNFSDMPKAQQLAVVPNLGGSNIGLFYSTMPIAKVADANMDHMPVAKVYGNTDKMPVKRIKVIPLMQSQQTATP